MPNDKCIDRVYDMEDNIRIWDLTSFSKVNSKPTFTCGPTTQFVSLWIGPDHRITPREVNVSASPFI